MARLRVQDKHALAMGWKLNSSKRYRVSDKERIKLNHLRADWIDDVEQDTGVSKEDIKHGWRKVDGHSVFWKNPLYKEEDYQDFYNGLIEDIKKYAPTYPKIKRVEENDGHLLVIDIADLHINKYADAYYTGQEYNSSVAVERALAGTKGLIQKSSGFNIDKILFVVGNDVLNTDTITNTTTRGTHQDTDLNWFTAFNVAKDCYIKCLEYCLAVADVDVIHCVSNHDYMAGSFLAETLSAWFRTCKNITFDCRPKYRKYYQYHLNMIELEHGDKGRKENIPLTMANEEPTIWAATKFRYAYLHHLHHQDIIKFQSGKDFQGVNVTFLRSPSSADLWHSDNQFKNMVAIEGAIHSKEHGRVSLITHYF